MAYVITALFLAFVGIAVLAWLLQMAYYILAVVSVAMALCLSIKWASRLIVFLVGWIRMKYEDYKTQQLWELKRWQEYLYGREEDDRIDFPSGFEL